MNLERANTTKRSRNALKNDIKPLQRPDKIENATESAPPQKLPQEMKKYKIILQSTKKLTNPFSFYRRTLP